MPRAILSAIAVLACLYTAAGASAAEPCKGAKPNMPASNEDARPKILEAWIEPAKEGDAMAHGRDVRVCVTFAPTSTELFYSADVNYDNKNGSGVFRGQPQKLSEKISRYGLVWQVRKFEYAGKYILTIKLRSKAGEALLTLPELKID
jgi:hypothetical protein